VVEPTRLALLPVFSGLADEERAAVSSFVDATEITRFAPTAV
jgi:hypothetical protein